MRALARHGYLMKTLARLMLAAILAWCPGWALAAPSFGPAPAPVPVALDLQMDAAAADAMGGALLLVFVREQCPYCEIVLKEFLNPMSRNPNYVNRVVMRRIAVGESLPLRDFRGEWTTHGRFAQGYGIRFTPIVQMFGMRGALLGKPLVGLMTRDYYGDYIDQAIDKAIELNRALAVAMQSPATPAPEASSAPISATVQGGPP